MLHSCWRQFYPRRPPFESSPIWPQAETVGWSGTPPTDLGIYLEIYADDIQDHPWTRAFRGQGRLTCSECVRFYSSKKKISLCLSSLCAPFLRRLRLIVLLLSTSSSLTSSYTGQPRWARSRHFARIARTALTNSFSPVLSTRWVWMLRVLSTSQAFSKVAVPLFILTVFL